MGTVNPGKSFDSFSQFLTELSGYCPHFVWRGVSKYSFDAMPRIGYRLKDLKEAKQEDYTKYELTVFDNFRAKARLHHETSGLNAFEWLAMAQHYGVPTRLLDWSENPIVALYFALYGGPGHENEDGAILAYHMSSFSSASSIDPFEIDHNIFVRAPFVTQRLAAQSAVFSVSKKPWEPFEPYGIYNIMKCRITPKFKKELATLLPKIGFTKQFIMADLDSYASNTFDDFQRAICPKEKIFAALD